MRGKDMVLRNFETDALNACAKCSLCVENCPVTKVNPEFPGPKQLGPDWLRLAQSQGLKPNPALSDCSNCKNCEIACPSGILVAAINQLAKVHLPKKKKRLREFVLANPVRLGKLMQLWPQGGNFVLKIRAVRVVTEKIAGISAEAPMPAYGSKSLRRICKSFNQDKVICQSRRTKEIIKIKEDKADSVNKVNKKDKKPKEVIYFPGCFTEYNKPQIGLSLIEVLNKLGYKVLIPNFKCCGQPAISNTCLEQAGKYAKHNFSQVQPYLEKGVPLLFTCPSCLLTFKEEYVNVLGLEEIKKFRSLLKDTGEFLREEEGTLCSLEQKKILPILPEGKNGRDFKLAYHQPCHLKAAGLGTPGFFLLKDIVRYTVHPLEAGCCGMAGSYGLKAEKQWIAQSVGKNVQDAINYLKPEAVVTECGMCAVQIGSCSHLPVFHPIELLARIIGDTHFKKGKSDL
jgi:glycerol-3-phosphate dehydrogenase subunit C